MIKRIVFIVFLGLLYNPFCIVAQDSIAIAEDIEEKKLLQFQEYFFKALSDKSINNYQKSIENLEASNEILPNNKSVYFELSKNYLLLNKTREAKVYIDKAKLCTIISNVYFYICYREVYFNEIIYRFLCFLCSC